MDSRDKPFGFRKPEAFYPFYRIGIRSKSEFTLTDGADFDSPSDFKTRGRDDFSPLVCDFRLALYECADFRLHVFDCAGTRARGLLIK